MPQPGNLLGDRYRILDVLSGGMGEVFICEWIKDAEPEAAPDGTHKPLRLALKTFQRCYFFDNAVRWSFVREATTWLRLFGLPHIMRVFGIEQIGDRPFLQMPVVEPGPHGERSIADLLKRGPLDPEFALGYAFQLGLALRQAANRIKGLVHGDLKPANVLLINGDACLADFGLVSAASLGRADYRLMGSLAYRAPELWEAETSIPTVATDVYAFGALLFEMLVGRTPFAENVHDPDALATAHRERSPAPPSGYPTDGLPAESCNWRWLVLRKDRRHAHRISERY